MCFCDRLLKYSLSSQTKQKNLLDSLGGKLEDKIIHKVEVEGSKGENSEKIMHSKNSMWLNLSRWKSSVIGNW